MIPEHWLELNLQSACHMTYGKGLPTKNLTQSGFPVFGANGIIGNYKTYLYEEPKIIISCRGAASGKIHKTLPKSYVTSNSIILDLISQDINIDFFKYAMIQADKLQIVTGSAQPQITIDNLNTFTFPLPPLNEQKRIVEKLDAILPKVKSAKAQLERIPTILKKFRKSVLTAACSGRLTEDCRAADDYSESDLPISWEDTPLLNLLKKKPNNGYSGKPVKFETSTRVLTLTATTSGIFNPMFYKYLDQVIDSNANCWLKHNDILMQRGNTVEYVGMPAIYKGTDNMFIFPDLMIRLTPNTSKINPDFLYYFLAWEKTRIQVRNSASGTAGTMPKINQSIFTELSLGVPSIEEQHEIVRRVEKLFSLADSLETKYKKAFSRVEKIEQSILAKAFRGELVEPDPNDEPAEELLKRILEEKAKLEGAKKTKKSTKKAPVKNKVAGNNKLLKKAKK